MKKILYKYMPQESEVPIMQGVFKKSLVKRIVNVEIETAGTSIKWKKERKQIPSESMIIITMDFNGGLLS